MKFKFVNNGYLGVAALTLARFRFIAIKRPRIPFGYDRSGYICY